MHHFVYFIKIHQNFDKISASWQTAFYFGSFVGPSISGILVGWVGFETSGLILSIFPLLMSLVDFVKKRRSNINEGLKYELVLSEDEDVL